jgi:hypothetical protein
MSEYSHPPSDPVQAEEWAYNNGFSAVAYAAGWTGSGAGYGPTQAKEEWPENPGFDFECGLPEGDFGLTEEDGYEYRTSLCYHITKDPEVEGWEFVAKFQVTAEPELCGEDGNISGRFYIGENSFELVYRRLDPDLEDDDEDDED